MNLKILTTWLASLVAASVITAVLWNLLAIPFIEGGAFTLIGILLTAVTIAVVLDRLFGIGIHDEHGWHLGIGNPMGPLVSDELEPPEKAEPIVSREVRRKMKA